MVMLRPAGIVENVTNRTCEQMSLTTQDYVKILWASAAEIPGKHMHFTQTTAIGVHHQSVESLCTDLVPICNDHSIGHVIYG